MNKSLKIYLLAFVAVTALVIVIDQSRKKPINWRPTYMVDQKNPLDLYVLNNELDSLMAGRTVTRYKKTPYEYFSEQDSALLEPQTYIVIGNDYKVLDKQSAKKLLQAVHDGSTLFVCDKYFSQHIIDSISAISKYEYLGLYLKREDSISLRLTNSEWKDDRYNVTVDLGMSAFTEIDTASTKALGYMRYPNGMEYISFTSTRFGKGAIILNNQPAIFSNYSLLNEPGAQQYAANVLSYLPPDLSIVWFVDEDYKTAMGKTPLSVIFKYPPLRTAWLILIYGFIVFIIFGIKRRQRVIPIIKPLPNTTVEFTKTIGNLYYNEGNPTNITQKKIIYFLDYVRRTYFIDTRHLDDAFIQRLHEKSGKNIDTVTSIVYFIRWFEEKKTCKESDLMRLNKFIDDFRLGQ